MNPFYPRTSKTCFTLTRLFLLLLLSHFPLIIHPSLFYYHPPVLLSHCLTLVSLVPYSGFSLRPEGLFGGGKEMTIDYFWGLWRPHKESHVWQPKLPLYSAIENKKICHNKQVKMFLISQNLRVQFSCPLNFHNIICHYHNISHGGVRVWYRIAFPTDKLLLVTASL